MATTAVVEPAHEPTKTGSPLLDRLWHAARSRGDCAPTADLFAALARRFALIHDMRHPRATGLAIELKKHGGQGTFVPRPPG
jgi:hypothetical protein